MALYSERTGAGRPLLLVHGLGGSVRSWDTIAAALSVSREVILVDIPGHGRSPPIPGRQTISAFADVLTEFIEGERLGSVDLVGNHLLLPRQAHRAQAAFPKARLHWFESCGHFPQWDQPDETVRLILEATD
jgi:pimeloyl-ACP methyl ester carboxylesterase